MPKLAQADRQADDDPLAELHPRRPVQPHGRHLPDADRLHARQGQPLGPARPAEPERLPQRRLERHQAQAARPRRCCRSSCCPGPCRSPTSSARRATPGFLGKAYDPYYMFQEDQLAAGKLNLDDLTLRQEISEIRLKKRSTLCWGRSTRECPSWSGRRANTPSTRYQGKAFDLILSGRARKAFNLDAGGPQDPRQVRPPHLRPGGAPRPPADRGRDAVRPAQLAVGGQRRPQDDRLGHPRLELPAAARPPLPEARLAPSRP